MSYSDLFKLMPALAGADFPKQYGRLLELGFKDELEDPEGVFKAPGLTIAAIEQRLQPAFFWAHTARNQKVVALLRKIFLTAAVRHAAAEHGQAHLKETGDRLLQEVTTEVVDYPEVQAVLPMEMMVMAVWF